MLFLFPSAFLESLYVVSVFFFVPCFPDISMPYSLPPGYSCSAFPFCKFPATFLARFLLSEFLFNMKGHSIEKALSNSDLIGI